MNRHNAQKSLLNGIEPLHVEAGDALRLSHISRAFDGVQALKDVSLNVASGEIICLVGHSGCGKTSLLRIIAGIDAPDSGTLMIGGKMLVGPSVFVEPEKRDVGVVFQDYALFPHLTVAQNVKFGLRAFKSADANHRVAELLQRVSLGDKADRYPHQLSGGEQQRVALIRALAPKPHVLLMDEPFSNLDRGLRASVRRETISLLRQLGTTAIIVTHEAEEALSTGDRVVLMRSGEIVQTGSAREIYQHPVNRYAAEFFCDFNVIPGRFGQDGVETPLGVFKANKTDMSSGQALVYLRPDDLHIVPDDAVTLGDIRGKVVSRSYFGQGEELILKVEGLENTLRIHTKMQIPHGVTHIFLRISAENALIFAD